MEAGKSSIIVVGFLLGCIFFDHVSAQEGNRYFPNMDPIRVSTRNEFVFRQIDPSCNRSELRFYRSFDGECTNPTRPDLGRARTPIFSYVRDTYDARRIAGTRLRSPRVISNIVLHQFDESLVDPNNKLTEFVTFFGQFLDHNVALASNDMENSFADQDIPVASDDPVYREDFIQFNRNIKANRRGVRDGPGWIRSINVLSSAVDLFAVYGGPTLAPDLRTGSDGLLRTSGGSKNLLPLNGEGINPADAARNAPVQEPGERDNFFIAGDTRSNENPQLTAIHTLFLRIHNKLAVDLAREFPGKSDEWYYQSARRVNQAYYQNIVWNEFLPTMTGRKLADCPETADGVQCFDPDVDVTLSDIFSVAGFRVGHTMVGNFIHRVGAGGAPMDPIELRDAFFHDASLIEADGIEPYIRGAITNQAQKIDNMIVDAMRNALFENVPEEEGFDLAAINIQRGRDTNLPSFSDTKRLFRGGSRVRNFRQISRNREVQTRLSDAYDRAADVELWVGLMSEDQESGKPMGPTLNAIWLAEFERLRNGDAYFYLNKNMYDPELLTYKPLIDTIEGRGPSMRDLILDHSDITNSEIPSNIWIN